MCENPVLEIEREETVQEITLLNLVPPILCTQPYAYWVKGNLAVITAL